MKTKLTLSITLLLIWSLSWSQTKQDGLAGSSELKINGLTTVIGYLEISYDRLLNDESSIGLSAGFSYDDSVDYKFAIVPYYRFFFSEERAAGFFIEANSAIFSEQSDLISNTGRPITNSDLGFGMGLAIGHKFVTNKNGYVGEIFAGAGRNFISSDIAAEVYPRFGISIGKRF